MPEPSNPIPTYILTATDLVPTPYVVGSLSEAILYEAQGVYTVTRTYHGDHALLLDAHLDRLEQSARLINIPLQLDRTRLRTALHSLLVTAGYPDAKFRITVPADEPDRIYLALEPFQPVPEIFQQQGVRVVTVPLVRPNPVVKTTHWMTLRRPTYDSLPRGVYEGILTSSDGMLLEGMSSNFYGVVNGALYTAGAGMLEGIIRHAILKIVPDILPVSLTAIHQSDLPHLSEAMLTSSGRGLVPITMVNDVPVGKGQVGPIVTDIRQRLNDWTEANLEPI